MSWKSYDIKNSVNVKTIYSIFSLEYDKDYIFKGEIHNFWECVYVIKGRVCVSADENVRNLGVGDIIFHKPMEMHKFFIDSDCGATLFIFSFSMEGTLTKKMSGKVFHLSNEQMRIMDCFIDLYETEKKAYPNTEKTAYNSLLSSKSLSDDIFLQKVANFIEMLILYLSQNESINKTADNYDVQLYKKAVDYMNEVINSALSVDELSKQLNISVSTLKRIFYKYAGMSVHKYFLTLKMKEATSLLQSGMSVSEVADRLGFSSQGYFSTAYKRETGNPPSIYK